MIAEFALRNKLHQELVNAGVDVISVIAINESEIGAKITFAPDVDMQLIQSIVDAHDPTPIPPQLSEVEKLRLEQAQANTELIQLIMMMGGGIA